MWGKYSTKVQILLLARLYHVSEVQVLSERDYTLILKGELACKRQTSGKVDTVSRIQGRYHLEFKLGYQEFSSPHFTDDHCLGCL